MTKGGVERNLPCSPYSHKLNNLTFYFSSRIYKEKFVSALANYTHDFRLMLEKKLSVDVIGCEDIASILLYKRTEKRGFYVTYSEPIYTIQKSKSCIVSDCIDNKPYSNSWKSMDEMFLDLGYTQICKKGIARGD